MKKLSLFLVLFLLWGCGQDKKKSSEVLQNVSALYSSASVTVKVFYEEGAEPYTDNMLSFKLWDILEVNLKALVEGRSPETKVTVPKSLTEMTKLGPLSRTSWSASDILALDRKYGAGSDGTTFRIYFVNGHAEEGGTIMGFHISGTLVMAVFKDVIDSSATGSGDIVPKYVEQATLVHELGHAFGLVNNGLPLTSSHQDTAHGHHCSKEDCVMYYSNEGTASLMKYVSDNILKNYNLVMYGQECLNDARKYR